MFINLLKWVISTVSVKQVHESFLYRPVELPDYLRWLTIQLENIEVADPSYKDYGHFMELYSKDAVELLTWIDVIFYDIDPEPIKGGLTKPDSSYKVDFCTLVDGDRLGSLEDFKKLLMNKTLTLLDLIEERDEVLHPYLYRRWGFVISDIVTIFESMFERSFTDTF